MRPVKLGNVAVGGDNPPYIVAEVGSNHNGDMDLCLRLIDAAAEAGANAVKFQSWSEDVAHCPGGIRAESQLRGQEEALRVAPRDGARLPAHARAARRCPRPLPGAWDRLLLQRVRPGGGGPAGRTGRPVHQDRLDGRHQPAAPGTCCPDRQARGDLGGDGHPGRDRAGHGYACVPRATRRSSCSTASPSIRRRRRPSTCATSRPCARPSTCPWVSVTTPWARRSRSPPSPWAHA